VALAASHPQQLYVAPGSFFVQPSHPLHRLAPRELLDLRRDHRCRTWYRGVARVVAASNYAVRLQLARGRRWVRLDSRTRFAGLGRPIAVVDLKQRLRVRVMICEGSHRPIATVLGRRQD
jgi:hypothetical protein